MVGYPMQPWPVHYVMLYEVKDICSKVWEEEAYNLQEWRDYLTRGGQMSVEEAWAYTSK